MVDTHTGSEAGQELSPEDWKEAEEKYSKHRPRKTTKTGKPLCKGVTVFGTPCQHVAGKSGYCRFHNPSHICAFRDGTRVCKRPAKSGSQYCEHHLEIIGHLTLTAPSKTNLPSFLKYLPASLAERAAAMDEDPELHNIRHDVVLLSARLTELLENLKNPTVNYYDMVLALDELRTAYDAGEDHIVSSCLFKLHRLMMEGVSVREAWSEVYEVMDRRQKAIMYERKQMMDDGGMIPVQQVMALMTRLLMVVSAFVKSPDDLQQIQAEFNRAALIGPTTIDVDAD